jgi:hypothetical protein
MLRNDYYALLQHPTYLHTLLPDPQKPNQTLLSAYPCALTGQAQNIQSDMPPNEYYELFKPDYSLFIKKDTAMRNENTALKVEKVRHGGFRSR